MMMIMTTDRLNMNQSPHSHELQSNTNNVAEQLGRDESIQSRTFDAQVNNITNTTAADRQYLNQ